jgi:hypothetical protein
MERDRFAIGLERVCGRVIFEPEVAHGGKRAPDLLERYAGP